jgi:hypothetical protein
MFIKKIEFWGSLDVFGIMFLPESRCPKQIPFICGLGSIIGATRDTTTTPTAPFTYHTHWGIYRAFRCSKGKVHGLNTK